MEQSSVINVGVAGLGRSGWDLHIRDLRANTRYSICAVCATDDAQVKEAERELGCVGYAEYRLFLQHPGLELVIVATPSADHVWMAHDALAQGMHVVLEKPLAPSSKEVEELYSFAKKQRKVLSPYYNFRFTREFLLLQSLLEKHSIGPLYLIRRQVGYFNRRDDWQSKRHALGGILNAATIHHIDSILQIVEGVPEVQWYDLRRLVSKGDASDHSKIILRFPNGCVADVEVSWVQALSGCAWLLYGTHGAIRVCDGTATVRRFDNINVQQRIAAPRSYLSGEDIPWQEASYNVEDGFSNVYYHRLADAIRTGSALPVSIESALKTMKVLEQCLHTT